MSKTVLDTFYNDLNQLKLNQFPCGPGKWRQEKEPHYCQESDAKEETLFSLQELARSDIWRVKEDWSNEISSLRRLAVKKPTKLTEKYIFEHFKTLRLVDKGINDVDEGLLKFANLKELSLTGNDLSSVKGANLPRSLTVLHLFANKLDNLDELARSPPKLQHIGAGHNNLTDITSYITPKIWPSLLSLDLSNNKISHLQQTIDCLSLITSLRSLSLVRNPITLAPCYYGYTLDKIPGLTILDDVSISLDDRLSFNKVSSLPLEWDNAIIRIAFPSVSNLRLPPTNEEIDEGSCTYPNQNEYSYFVRFCFISAGVSDHQQLKPFQVKETTGEVSPVTPKHRKSSVSSGRNSRSEKPSVPAVVVHPETPETDTIKKLKVNDKPNVEGIPQDEIVFFNTDAVPWSEEPVQFHKGIDVRCSNLHGLDVYLHSAVQFTLVEKIVESHTEVVSPDEALTPPVPAHKKQPAGKDKDKKKKKDDKSILKNKDGELLTWIKDEPTYKEVACIEVNLATLLTRTNIKGELEAQLMEPAPECERRGSFSSHATQNQSNKTNPKKGRDKSAKSKGAKSPKVDKAAGKKKPPASPACVPENKTLMMSYDITRIVWSSTAECRAAISANGEEG